ncbi:Retrovirus-related Pol polyprotein from transposon 412 [Anabarilius grahami]|uniref:Gypsy retrotransposon integrase-like protein 1 n=1 Tax=Anabarilius grahami TaxID=495550 RepID=A0A3N0YBT8_ANAGA|nr:Retrovirus-related Pol polyprotein from transposon 412 [Anabarilius grahami]
MMYPTRLAIIKCQAHKKGNDFVIRGNNAADSYAKQASGCQLAVMAPSVLIQPIPTLKHITEMQNRAPPYEVAIWQQRGATRDANGLWRSHEGHMIAPNPLLNILITDAHGVAHCARGEILKRIKRQGFWSPYMQQRVDEYLSECEICAQNNVKRGTATPLGSIPVPEGPFKHLVLDYVDMIKSVRGKRYMLVIIDRFSRWVEAEPLADQGAKTVIRFLTREVIPRFGIPSQISSDNGSAFIQRTVKTVIQQLRIKQRLGCIYHPSSQGIVERVNGTLKTKLNKICADTKLNWVDALPLALMSYRMQTNRVTNLTPHEMLTGRLMPAPHLRGPYEGPPLEQLETEIRAYMRQLTTIHEAIHTQEQNRGPGEEEEAPCPVLPGDQVYLRVFRRRWNEPRREGPYTVVRATPTAIQVEGKTTWYHLNHCTRVPRLRRREEEAENAEEDADQEAHEGEGSGDPGEGPSNVVAEPSSREAEQPETRDEMRGQHEDPQASETEREGPDTGPAASVPTEPTATDPEPSGDQSPEAGPSTNEQPQPNGFLTELQGIDLPTADSDSPDINLPDLSHTGDFPTLSLRDLEEIIGSAPTQDD